MSKRDRDDRKRRKTLLHDREQQRRKEHAQRIEIGMVAVTQRIKDRFTADERKLFLERTLEKYKDGKKRNPKISRWLSEYRTLYGDVCVLAEGDKFIMTYRDEVPNEIRKAFPTFGTPQFKYSDVEWKNFVQAVWKATGGDLSGMKCAFEKKPNAICIEPSGEDGIKISGPENFIRKLSEMTDEQRNGEAGQEDVND